MKPIISTEDNLKRDKDGFYINAPNYEEVRACLNAHYKTTREDKIFMPFIDKIKKLIKK